MRTKIKRTTVMVAATAIAGLLLLPVAAVAAGPGAGGGGGGSGGGKPGGETAGNNLSYPVEWSEGAYQLVLPGTMGTATISGTVLPGTLTMDDSTPCYGAIQKEVANVWQAENVVTEPVNAVTTIDWGDNLESKDWRAGQVVRVETGLYDEALGMDAEELPVTMKKYEMCYITGSGTSEVWGVQLVLDAATGLPVVPYTAVTTESTTAMVYTGAARLTIQMVDATKIDTLVWDPVAHLWTGPGVIGAPVFNKATWEKTADGPGSYGAELNVQGKVVYGYVWTTRGLTAGEYRLTFSIDQALPTGTPGVTLAGAEILAAVEGEAVAEDEVGGNTPVVDDLNNLTYIDVGLTAGGGGGGRPR
jgi:hypothetical protein